MVRAVPENHNTTPGDYDHDDPELDTFVIPQLFHTTLVILQCLKACFPTAWRSLRRRLLLFFMLASKIPFVFKCLPMQTRTIIEGAEQTPSTYNRALL